MDASTFAQIQAARLSHFQAADTTAQSHDTENHLSVRRSESSDVIAGTGISYQKCGGGKRVLRKKIGGN